MYQLTLFLALFLNFWGKSSGLSKTDLKELILETINEERNARYEYEFEGKYHILFTKNSFTQKRDGPKNVVMGKFQPR